MIPFGLLYALLVVAASQPLPIVYLISERTPVALATRDSHSTIRDAVVQSVTSGSRGKQLAFWCESLHGPIASCFAQTFTPEGLPESQPLPVFDLPPTVDAIVAQGDGRFVSQWGTALWTGDDEALLLLAYLRPNEGNRLLVQHWKSGKLSPPATITTRFDLDSWATLVRAPSGKVFAVWLERERSSFTICERQVGIDGAPTGEPVRLQAVQEPPSPGAVAVAANASALTIAWTESYRYQAAVYARQFDDAGKPLGEPQRLFQDHAVSHPAIATDGADGIAVAATTPDGHVLVQTVGHAPVEAAENADSDSVRIGIANNGEIALAWRDTKRVVWFRSLSRALEPLGLRRVVATNVARPFLALDARGSSWLLHFRKRPDNASAPYLWLASARVPVVSADSH